MNHFDRSLARGQMGESVIARWLRERDNSVLPIYEKEIDTGKGPRFFAPDRQYVAPDMFVMPAMQWVEAKHKTVFSWHRKTCRWCTGIDLNHYAEYQKVEEVSRRPVWVFFLHREDKPDDRDIRGGCPSKCPTGLFGSPLSHLRRHENHRHENWGRHGMVYWAHETLKQLETIESLTAILGGSLDG